MTSPLLFAKENPKLHKITQQIAHSVDSHYENDKLVFHPASEK